MSIVETANQLSGRATTEELTWIRDAIMLPYMLDLAELKRQEMVNSSNTFKVLYEKALSVLMDRVTQDLVAVRKNLRERKIKLFEDGQGDLVLYTKYVCRGYEDRFGVVREVLRAEMSKRFGAYISDIFKALG